MTELYLAKISYNNNECFIFTNGSFFSPVKDFFPHINNFSDLLLLNAKDITVAEFKYKIPTDSIYLDLIENQHIFATGCTYEWSKEQLDSTSNDDVYKRLYLSERPMFFYKGNRLNCSANIGIRKDAQITIPEAELVAVFNYAGEIIGYTLGNDVTALDIEKSNPLFQAQAKFYKGSVSLLPMIRLGEDLPKTNLRCQVLRNSVKIVETVYNTSGFNRSSSALVKQLMRSELNPSGGFLFLGCGKPYPTEFGLIKGDSVVIESEIFPISLQNKCLEIGNSYFLQETSIIGVSACP